MQEKVLNRSLLVYHVTPHDQWADALAKPLSSVWFKALRYKLKVFNKFVLCNYLELKGWCWIQSDQWIQILAQWACEGANISLLIVCSDCQLGILLAVKSVIIDCNCNRSAYILYPCIHSFVIIIQSYSFSQFSLYHEFYYSTMSKHSTAHYNLTCSITRNIPLNSTRIMKCRN